MSGRKHSLGVALSALACAFLLLALAAFADDLTIDPRARHILGIGGIALALVAGPLLWTFLQRFFEGLSRLETAVRGIAEHPGRILIRKAPAQVDAELSRLWHQIAVLSERNSPDLVATERLASVLAALPQPVIVVTDQGLVTLANRPASDLLGSERLRTGTSIFDAIDRASLGPLLRSPGAATPIQADLALCDGGTLPARLRALPDHRGTVIVLEAGAHGAAGLQHAMELHEALPPRLPPTSETPLDSLTAMVLDCESTGLNVGFDRVLSLGAVRLQGAKLIRGETVDAIFDPGEAIPAASTAIHGITDAMAMAEKPLAERWAEIEPALRDCVIIGHNIGFDLTLLEIELRRAGIRWQRPLSLCTVQLASVLDPHLPDLNLETVAAAYGIDVAGRHTALGDALATAEIYLRLLALMKKNGDRTLADALARAATARRVIRQQQEAGW